VTDSGEDAQLWNGALEEMEKDIGLENCTWFRGPWLFAECYMYRRVREAMLLCKTDMKHCDPYENSKLETHEKNANTVFQLIAALCPLNLEEEKTNVEVLKRRYVIAMEVFIFLILYYFKTFD
jgi:hypothetical protein